jgi:riboflavin biosynthesis pyrimidine reductase
MQVPLRRVLPVADGPITIAEAYAAPLGQRIGRPWVGLSMVASLDGSTVVDGVSSGLSSDNDASVLQQLRSVAQVIIVGAGTVRGEGYGKPKTPGQRIGVVTRSGSVDTTGELFRSGAGFLITTEQAEIDAEGVDVLRAGVDEVDLRDALERLPDLCPGVDFVQAEGGATLNAALADADLFDELNVTTSPATVGGGGPRLFHGGTDHSHRYDLEQLVVDDESFLFSRWRRRVAPTSP